MFRRTLLGCALFLFLFAPLATFATGYQSDVDTGGAGGCNPGSTYDPNLPKGETDQQGKKGLLGLGCIDTTDGHSTPGTCVAADKCAASNPAGTPTSQQMSNANNGASANGTPAQNSTGQESQLSGGSSGAQVSPNPGISTSATVPPSPASSADQSTAGLQSAPGPGTSALVSAYQWLTGEDSSAPQYQGGNPNGATDNSQQASQLSWLTGAQQYQLQSDTPAPPLQSAESGVPTGPADMIENPGFAPISTPQGNLGPSDAEVQAANDVTLSPMQQAAQDLQNVAQGIKDTGGSWAQGAQQYLDGQAQPAQTVSPPVNLDASEYYPGCINAPSNCSLAMEGGTTGSTGMNLLNQPAVAVGQNSPYDIGDKLNITNPATGQSVQATVGDLCNACTTSGRIDLNQVAANAVGLNNNVVQVQVSTVGTAADPWSAPAGSLPATVAEAPLAGGWIASTPDINSFGLTLPNNETLAFDSGSGPAAGGSQSTEEAISESDKNFMAGEPSGQVDNGGQLAPVQPTLQETPSSQLTPIGAQAQEDLMGGLASNNQIFSAQQTVGAQFAENGPANPSGTVENGGALAEVPQPGPANPAGTVETGPQLEQPNPSGVVESSPLSLSEPQIVANVPVPEQVSTNPQAEVEAQNAQDGEAAQLQDRLAQADQEEQDANNTQAGEQAQLADRLAQADAENVPTQGEQTSGPIAATEGEQTTGPVAATEREQTQAPVVATQGEQTTGPAQPSQSSFDQILGAAANAQSTIQGWYQSVVDSLQQYAIDNTIPTPETTVQSGEQVTSNIQQTVAQEIETAFVQPQQSAPAQPATQPEQTDQPLAEVSNTDRTFTAFDTNVAPNALANGTTITSSMLSPDSVALGAASYNPEVAQAISQSTQFTQTANEQPQTGLDGGTTPIENPPLPEARPADAGATGIDLSGCGGVCEQGNTGADVKAIQQFLASQGYNPGPIDGIYGPQTANAVQDYQGDNNIKEDGIVGSQTVGSMNTLAASENAANAQSSENSTAVSVTQDEASPKTDTQVADTQAPTTGFENYDRASQDVEKTYTLSNAGDLRGEFLVNPVTAALIPDSMKQQLIEANETAAQTVTFTQSQLDSIKWGLMSGSQATQVQSVLSQAGYQVPSDVVISDRPPGIQDIANLQMLSQQRATAMTAMTSNLSGSWTGF